MSPFTSPARMMLAPVNCHSPPASSVQFLIASARWCTARELSECGTKLVFAKPHRLSPPNHSRLTCFPVAERHSAVCRKCAKNQAERGVRERLNFCYIFSGATWDKEMTPMLKHILYFGYVRRTIIPFRLYVAGKQMREWPRVQILLIFALLSRRTGPVTG